MKNVLKTLCALSLFSILIASCGRKEDGQLTGVQDRPKWKGINPYGMVYIPSNTLYIGAGDEDLSSTYVQRPKSISIQGFFMDDTEITNNEYRQFVDWVRDSLAHTMLDHFTEDESGEGQHIDWEQEIDWSDETLNDLYYQGADKFAGRKEFNVNKFEYEYQWMDWRRAANDRTAPRTKYIKKAKLKSILIQWYGFVTSHTLTMSQ